MPNYRSISWRLLSIALSILILLPDGGFADQGERKLSVKEQVLEIPAGAIVELRTKGKEKVRGRIGEAGEESFAVQRVKNDKVEALDFSYQDIKSIKVVAEAGGTASKVGRTVGYVILGGLAALGVLALVGIAIAASGGCC